MLRFAFTIFLSAFLVFQIQPIIARFILPWYGGTSAVWTVCLLFFQLMLLMGYSYAHVLRLFLSPFRQAIVHLSLLACGLLLLPVTPNIAFKTGFGGDPFSSILILLTITIGIPYLLVSASGPLLQHWFKLNFPDSSPYRLYSLSNIGSLLGLLTYPFLIEPLITLQVQTWIWSFGFFMLVISTAACSLNFVYIGRSVSTKKGRENSMSDSTRPKNSTRILWVLLSASASVLLLATTNQVCQDIASVPFLWLLPLSLYLLSFIICFDHARWYKRRFWLPIWCVSMVFGIYVLLLGGRTSILFQIVIYNVILFSGCMICHGEMVRLKPHPDRLTGFYLLIALGGALGGVFVTVVAPYLFDGYWELPLVWCAILLLVGVCLFQKPLSGFYWRNLFLQTTWITAYGLLALVLFIHVSNWNEEVIYVHRNFYGVLRVKEIPPEQETGLGGRSLMNGAILHGNQVRNDMNTRRWPTTYFGWNSGIGLAIKEHPDHGERDREFRIGVVGMGIGTIAALCSKHDTLRFYEINPKVIEVSGKYFSFLQDSPASWQVVEGDARISLERELKSGEQNQFHILAIDAFSGDAIPVHLLTLEAFSLYQEHLREDGILAVHISNRHLDLTPVVMLAAEHLGKETVVIEDSGDVRRSTQKSLWVLLTNNEAFLNKTEVIARSLQHQQKISGVKPWTDNYSNLIGALKW